ncbi:cytoskeleton-associated protein 2 [Notolabrus celidotus]|uniref:cytoskeleton-associated protein 2 n=1 Tax=Notolabrus celidotus TaxID=1203425 RepID=UPI0014901445|nr:cytoskeleton-associated protein 2 [Notolabrus celidotus]XP_034540220.1 cytoskeleton-associated protein 2 [Notolabrus celidotus]
METVSVSRRNHTNKKENKENAQPAFGSESVTKREKRTAPPFQLKGNKKEETLAKNGPLKAKEKQADTRSMVALKKTVQITKKGDVKQRLTHSQAFLSEQAVKHRKMVAEAPKPPAPKPPAPVPSSKSAPGMYKGKIVQSKIGSIWKSSSSISDADPKPSAPKVEGQRVGNMTKSRSKSVADQLRNDAHKPAPTRSKSVSERRVQVSKPSITSRPPAGFRSARPPARTVPATLTSTETRKDKAAAIKGCPISRPKGPVRDGKVNKPPVSSTISQFRLNSETAEERRAKLADWLASKGKTMKRPAMTTAPATQSKKVSTKPKAEPKPQSRAESQPVMQCNTKPVPKPSVEAHKPDAAAAALCADTQRTEVMTQIQTPAIMNTTLDLLENTNEDLFDGQQGGVEDIVVNLCDALEAMATPSRCSEVSTGTDVCSEVEVESETMDGCKEEVRNEKPEDVSEQLKAEQVKDGAGSDEDEVELDEEAESDGGVMETTPQREDASVVKYSVKTTPYLQSVKKTIEGEVSTSTSRKRSNIKDLKFLTPVRRSCRIERKSSRLPSMLVDHDPCVTSLAELVKLDEDSNAYIYRKNPALLEDLPDQPRM